VPGSTGRWPGSSGRTSRTTRASVHRRRSSSACGPPDGDDHGFGRARPSRQPGRRLDESARLSDNKTVADIRLRTGRPTVLTSGESV